jgi:uncharacterized membrane protein
MANQQWTILLSVTFFRWRFNGVRVTPYLAFCVVFCCQLVSFSVFLFILAIAMSVLGITASYYPIYLQRFLDRNILHQLRDICSIYRWCSNFLHINEYWKKNHRFCRYVSFSTRPPANIGICQDIKLYLWYILNFKFSEIFIKMTSFIQWDAKLTFIWYFLWSAA